MGKHGEVVTLKSILLVVMFFVTLFFVVLPILAMQLRLVKKGNASRRKFILSLFNCFGGGIFLAVGFLHLLKEVVEDMESAFDELLEGKQEYPFANFVVCIGFLMILLIEHIVLSCEGNKRKLEEDEASLRNGLSGATGSGMLSQSLMVTRNANPRSSSPNNDVRRQEKIKITENKRELASYSKERTYDSEETIMENRGTLHAFTVALALSVHSIFEGLAFGLQGTVNQVVQVFFAIIIHKSVLAFSLGISFVTTKVRWKTTSLLTLTFCVASPLGAVVGTILSSSDGESVTITLLNAILSGIATGTFFYVAFVEVISYEMSYIEPQYKAHRLLLVLAIVIGFTIFAALSFIQD